MRKAPILLLALLCAGPAAAQERAPPGDPLPGLTPVEFELFSMGIEDFLEVEDAEEGLGPAYNGTSCGACHNVPAVGGVSPVAEVRAGRVDAAGVYSDVVPGAGSLFQMFSIPTHGCQAAIPPAAKDSDQYNFANWRDAPGPCFLGPRPRTWQRSFRHRPNVIARRVPIPLFGAGLVEAIPDETLLVLADPLDRDRDGVSGRAAVVEDLASGEPRVGRFGWKAQHATLLAFGADAYRNEMGITSDLFPEEVAFGVDPRRMRLCDPIPDPEDAPEPATGRRGIDNFEAFMRFLAPIGRGPIDEQVRTGERVFEAVGCAACHVPALVTGPSANPLFDRRQVPLYSDLLLHDVATGDGIGQAAAAPNEVRTPALWGLRFRRPLLHDGRAATVDAAIRAHGEEAVLARTGYDQLGDAARAALLAFLDSL